MPWCRSVWITRNRANPGNGIVDGYWGPGTGPWCFEPLIHGKRDPDRSDQTLMRHSRMLTKQCVLGTPLRKGRLPSQHIENILKWSKRTFSNMPYGRYPRNRFVMDLSHDKPYIYISSLILYKNLLFSAMYSRWEWAPTRIKSSLSQWLLSVIRFSKSHPKGVSVNPEETWFLNTILLNHLLSFDVHDLTLILYQKTYETNLLRIKVDYPCHPWT